MRNGELYALEWDDIDFENLLIRVSKSYNSRIKAVKSTKAAIIMKICGWKTLKTMEYYVRLAGVNEAGATEVLNILPTEREVMDNVVSLFTR